MPFNASACTPELVAALQSRRLAWLQAAFLALVGYGIVLALFTMCMGFIWHEVSQHISLTPRSREGMSGRGGRKLSRRTLALMVYILVMTTLSTLTIVSTIRVTYKRLIFTGCWDGVTTARTPIHLDMCVCHISLYLSTHGSDERFQLGELLLGFSELGSRWDFGVEMLGHLPCIIQSTSLGSSHPSRFIIPIYHWCEFLYPPPRLGSQSDVL